MKRMPASLGDGIVERLPRLRRFARALTRHAADADDLVQIAVERALASAAPVDDGAALDRWLFRILRNAWIDELRRRGRWGQVLAPAEAGDAVGEEPTTGQEILMTVQAALETLPDEQRLAVALVLVEGFSYQEAADVLEVPLGTLTSRLARAREALQSALGGDGERITS